MSFYHLQISNHRVRSDLIYREKKLDRDFTASDGIQLLLPDMRVPSACGMMKRLGVHV